MKLADPDITTEAMEPTASQSRPADVLTTAAAVSRRSAALDVCVASSIAAAARGDAAQAAFDRKLSYYRNEIGDLGNRMFTTARQCGPWAGGRIQPSLERFSTRQTSPPVETGSNGRRNPFIAGGNTKSKWPSCAGGQPWHAQFSQILQ